MNPYEALNVDPDADADEIRAAWLEAVRLHPPDRDPEAFQRIRAAYAVLGDPAKRAALVLFGSPELQTLTDLAKALGTERRRVGPGPWLAALSG